MIDLLLNLTTLPEDFQNIVTITIFCRTNNNYI